MSSKPVKNPAPEQLYDTETALRATADKLRGMLESIETHGGGEHGSTIRDVARISVALTATCAELRQHAKAAVREIAKIPLDQVVSYLKSLPEQQRIDIARELTNEDAEEPVL